MDKEVKKADTDDSNANRGNGPKSHAQKKLKFIARFLL